MYVLRNREKLGGQTPPLRLALLSLGPRHCGRRGWEHCFLVAYVWCVWQWEVGAESRRQVRGQWLAWKTRGQQQPGRVSLLPYCLRPASTAPRARHELWEQSQVCWAARKRLWCTSPPNSVFSSWHGFWLFLAARIMKEKRARFCPQLAYYWEKREKLRVNMNK